MWDVSIPELDCDARNLNVVELAAGFKAVSLPRAFVATTAVAWGLADLAADAVASEIVSNAADDLGRQGRLSSGPASPEVVEVGRRMVEAMVKQVAARAAEPGEERCPFSA